MIIGGAVLGWLSIWKPYQAALAGSPSVSLNQTGIGVAILFPIMGIGLVVGGQSLNDHFKANASGVRTKRGWVYLIVLGAIALATFLFVQSRFEALGYTS